MKSGKLQDIVTYYAHQWPEKTVIEYGNRYVSYLELEESANQIANFFKDQSLEKENILILLDRSPELVKSLLGILKCGGVFVPLDTKYPGNRIRVMAMEVQADWIITETKHLDKLSECLADKQMNVLVLDSEMSDPVDEYPNLKIFHLGKETSKDFSDSEMVANKHCYIYFTSGSTGTPKGVWGRHRSLLHFIQWEIKEFNIDESFRVSQFTSPSFDASLRDIFVPLSVGATICIPKSDEIILNPFKLSQWIDQNQISLLHMTPSLFKSLMIAVDDSNCFASLKYILMAGEKLRGNDIKKFIEFFSTRIQLVNLYGATETTLIKFFYRIKESDIHKTNIPVGKPMDRTEAIILDHNLKRCRTESIGEVYIRTPFISSGYYNCREMTREVFIKNPFNDNPQDIIYKTGDLGMILPDGNIELVGRIDHQIKIRGMRVETGEIENKLLDYDEIIEACVLAREEADGELYLCAYIVANENISVVELRKSLANILPDYMIPTYFVKLDKMPLLTNGKIDFKSLPEPEQGVSLKTPYMAPTNEIEEKLVTIWANVLGVDQVGINNSFFELGGHSLKAAALAGVINKEFNMEISLREIFKRLTIKSLAEYIRDCRKKDLFFDRKDRRSRVLSCIFSSKKTIYSKSI